MATANIRLCSRLAIQTTIHNLLYYSPSALTDVIIGQIVDGDEPLTKKKRQKCVQGSPLTPSRKYIGTRQGTPDSRSISLQFNIDRRE